VNFTTFEAKFDRRIKRTGNSVVCGCCSKSISQFLKMATTAWKLVEAEPEHPDRKDSHNMGNKKNGATAGRGGTLLQNLGL
jgi:hypothetical protein